MNLLDYVSNMKEKLREAWDVASRNLKQAQRKMKIWHDKKARDRQFKVGDKVLALFRFPISRYRLSIVAHILSPRRSAK